MAKKTAKNAAPTVNLAAETGIKLAAAFTTAQAGTLEAKDAFEKAIASVAGRQIRTIEQCAAQFKGLNLAAYDEGIKPHVVAALAKAYECEPTDMKVTSPASKIKSVFIAFANGLAVDTAKLTNFQKFYTDVAKPFVAAAFPNANPKKAGRTKGTTGKDAQSLDKTLKPGKVDATERAKACRVLAHVGDVAADVTPETLRLRASMLNKCVLQGNKLFWLMVADIAGKLDK